MASTLAILARPAGADSPLTAIDFWKAYTDLDPVQLARRTGQLDQQSLEFLLSPAPLDQKVALINALPNYPKKSNRDILKAQLMQVHQCDAQTLLSKLSGQQACYLGYLVALENVSAPQFGFEYLAKAQQEFPKSFTVAIIQTIVQAQDEFFMHQNRIGPLLTRTLSRPLRQDMRPQGRALILEYLRLYQDPRLL